jgi:hypothetical protein
MRRAAAVQAASVAVFDELPLYELPLYELPLYEFTLNRFFNAVLVKYSNSLACWRAFFYAEIRQLFSYKHSRGEVF